MTWLDEPWKEWSNSCWTKHEFLCTECDTLMEITTYWKDEYIATPICPCPHQAIVKLNTHKLPGSIFASHHSDVTSITPTPLVKINSNPYN
jgi:hypothetical protein